jgi:hypothetical protein
VLARCSTTSFIFILTDKLAAFMNQSDSSGLIFNLVSTKMADFWDFVLCSMVEIDQSFRRTYSHLYQSDDALP